MRGCFFAVEKKKKKKRVKIVKTNTQKILKKARRRDKKRKTSKTKNKRTSCDTSAGSMLKKYILLKYEFGTRFILSLRQQICCD